MSSLTRSALALFLMAAFWSGCKTAVNHGPGNRCRFIGLDNFTGFQRTTNTDGSLTLLSPVLEAKMDWDEMVPSWNASLPDGACLLFEARAIRPGHNSKFYAFARWSPDNSQFTNTSFGKQTDEDGAVFTDTLVLSQPATGTQLRITLRNAGQPPALPAFIGLSFLNSKCATFPHPPNRAAWGKTIPVPELSQFGAWTNRGWCSPATVAMVLSRWCDELNRRDLKTSTAQAAAGVYDVAYQGTGNWSFNTAWAGSFPAMRGYVTRLEDLSEVEDWIVAGVPVVLSARWDWLRPGRPADDEGHLIVCVGFTENGDVIANDPAARPERGQSVRQIYKRSDVVHAWSRSKQTVYLIYPVGTKIPPDGSGHWSR